MAPSSAHQRTPPSPAGGQARPGSAPFTAESAALEALRGAVPTLLRGSREAGAPANPVTALRRAALEPGRVPARHDPADKFITTMRAAPPVRRQPIPDRYVPLASAIVGHTDIEVRHDPVSRRALAAAGARAATVGTTIHLDRAPATAEDAVVLAHELTHVAHPSDRPRFFDDPRPSAEERQAEAVARLIRRSPALLAPQPPRGPESTPGGAPTTAAETSLLRPSRATAAGSAPIAASASAATPTMGPPAVLRRATEHAAPSTARGSSRSAGQQRTAATTVRRTRAASAGRATPSATGTSTQIGPTPAPASSGGVIRRAYGDDGFGGSDSASQNSPVLAHLSKLGGVHDFVDWIVERVEDRVRGELQRRGGRFREDF